MAEESNSVSSKQSSEDEDEDINNELFRRYRNVLLAAEAQRPAYNFDFAEQCIKAANAVKEADVLVLFTGAGFSADSGLAVYNDVARIPAYQRLGLEYMDICQPHFLAHDPELFYGFWGQCFNDYRSTQPHEGYEIIRQWKEKINDKRQGFVETHIQNIFRHLVATSRPFEDEDTKMLSAYEVSEYEKPPGAFYCFTSNVDAHSYDTFESHEIFECHGNIEVWQCSENEFICSDSGLWRAPMDFKFEVDQRTMKAPFNKSNPKNEKQDRVADKAEEDDDCDDAVPHIGHTHGQARTNPLRNMPPAKNRDGWRCPKYLNGTEANWPTCSKCRNPARPAILMFGDFDCKRDQSSKDRWQLFVESLLLFSNRLHNNDNPPLKTCIMEIGCGLNVPTCRNASERLVSLVQSANGDAKLVRINPDYPMVWDPDIAPHSIPIKSCGLEAIRKINESLQQG